MPHHGGVNFQMADGSVRMLHGTRPITLAALAQGLRRRGPNASAIAWGTPGPAVHAVVTALRRQGVALGALTLRAAQGSLPVLMVIADQRHGAAGPGAAVVFLVADGGVQPHLLLPAVQCAREAARRALQDGEIELVLVRHPAGPGQPLAGETFSLNFEKIDID